MKTKSITIYQKEGLRDWLLQQPIKEVVAKLMYVLTPEQMLLLIKLHDIKIVEPKPAKQRTKKKPKPTKRSVRKRK